MGAAIPRIQPFLYISLLWVWELWLGWCRSREDYAGFLPSIHKLHITLQIRRRIGWIRMLGWRDVPKRRVPARMFWDPWSPNKSFIVTQCPWIDASLSLCIIQYFYVGVKWLGCINAGTMCFRDDSSGGSGVLENSYWDTSFRDVPSPHHPYYFCFLQCLGSERF